MRKVADGTPFPRSYWVIPGRLLAGEFPGAENRVDARGKPGRLIDCGIRTIVNLMEPHETDQAGNPFTPYEPIVSQIAEEKGLSIDCHRLPIADLGVPDGSQTNA